MYSFWNSRLKIHHYVSLVALLAIIPMLFLGATLSYNLISKGNELRGQHISSVQNVHDEINTFFEKYILAMDTLAKQAGEMNLSPADLQEAITQFVEHYEGFYEIYLDTPEFQISNRVYSVTEEYRENKREQLFSTINASDFMTLGKTYVSPLIRDILAKDTIIIAIPIKNSANVYYGYIMGSLDLVHLNEIIGIKRIYPSTYVVLVDSWGNIIPYSVEYSKEISRSSEIIVNEINSNQSGSLEYFSPTYERWEIAGFDTVPELGWGIWAAAPRNEVLLPLYRSAGLFALLIIISVTVIFLMRRILVVNISRPLTRLDEACQEYSLGNMSYRVKFANDRLPTEMISLGEKFNNMAANIQHTNTLLVMHSDTLEESVAKRTSELVEKNDVINKEHNTLLAVINSINEGLILFNERMELVYANPIVIKQFDMDYHDQKWQGMTVNELKILLNKSELQIPWDELAEDFINKRSFQHRQATKVYREKVLYFMLMGFPVLSNGDFIGYGYIIRDVTREKEIESLKDSILSTVSHELRTPLTTIRGCAESLLRKDAKWKKDEQKEFAQAIVDESIRLRELIENIMDMSKIEAGALVLDLHPVDLVRLIERVVSRQRVLNNIDRINIESKHKIPFVLIDEHRMEQVLNNLVENGLKYSEDEDPIKIIIEYDPPKEFVKVSVVDRGIGIDARYHEAIFERFYRINTPLTNKVRGSGVGLSIAKGIIEAHGGSISVESQGEKGTAFIFTIPCKNHIRGEMDETDSFDC